MVTLTCACPKQLCRFVVQYSPVLVGFIPIKLMITPLDIVSRFHCLRGTI